jgi:microcystin-dependent protein
MPAYRRPNLATQAPRPERRHFLKRMLAVVAGGAVFAGAKQAFAETQAPTGATPYLGEVMLAAWAIGGPPPTGWMECDGQELQVSSNTALFSLLGTTYGGNGQTTFRLPDLRGRVPIHDGAGPGLTNRLVGQQGGAENVQLTAAQLPAHTHAMNANTGAGTELGAGGNYPASNAAGEPQYAPASNTTMGAGGVTGTDAAHQNMPPYTVIRFYISTAGQYPPIEPQP